MDAVESFSPPRTLAILGQPKPQQGRFYLQTSDGRPRAGENSREEAGYRLANRVRGPKVYPHHQDFREENWKSADRSNQNRSVTGWVKEGVEFAFDLHVTNLSRIELGALVWLLTLPPEHFHRLGLGKPLGFGSVRLQIQEEGARVATGAAWTEAALNWSSAPKWVDVMPCQQEFDAAMKAANASLLRAFLRAAAGFAGTAIHYPRLPDQLQGEHFKWFKSNEEGKKHSLPDLHGGDVTLPREPSLP